MRSLSFSGVLPKMAERMMQGGMRGGMMGGNSLPVGSNYPIFTARVTRKVSDSPKLPSQLANINWYKISDTANPDRPLPIGISEGPMAMLLNGRPYAYNDVQAGERIPVNSVQLMEIFHTHGGGHGQQSSGAKEEHKKQGGGMGMMNGMNMHGGGEQEGDMKGMGGGMGMMHGGEGRQRGMMGGMGKHGGGGQQGGMMGMGGGMGMMMAMAHPIHLHGQSFQIVSRSIDADEGADYATVREGFIESGLKDTVLVMPGERVRIIKPFQDFKGLFMYHCHNLEHEDMGMMRDFSVE
jgi:hypothetical protein